MDEKCVQVSAGKNRVSVLYLVPYVLDPYAESSFTMRLSPQTELTLQEVFSLAENDAEHIVAREHVGRFVLNSFRTSEQVN